jgi:HD-GYP domain-containing protein (c-di-GMP phosphodiesterase class II)
MNYKRFQNNQKQQGTRHGEEWIRKYIADVLLMGLLWASLYLQIIYTTEPEVHYFAMAVGLGLSGAAIVTMGSVFIVYSAFVTPMLLTLIFTFFVWDTYTHTIAAFVTMLGLVYLLYTDYKFSMSFLQVLRKNEQLRETELEVLECLGKAGEFRDTDTGAHVIRVGYAAYLLAKAAGLTERDAKLLMLASPLHDVGKIGISDLILLKPGKLTEEEFTTMKEHSRIGSEILKNGKSKVIQLAKIVAASHHEKWDGSGYPNKLAKEDIPIEGRIVAICDVYDALTSERPYKKAWSESEATEILRKDAGSHFDPWLVELFIKELPKIKAFSTQLEEERDTISHPLLQLALEGQSKLFA